MNNSPLMAQEEMNDGTHPLGEVVHLGGAGALAAGFGGGAVGQTFRVYFFGVHYCISLACTATSSL